jgi:hypothetical protein
LARSRRFLLAPKRRSICSRHSPPLSTVGRCGGPRSNGIVASAGPVKAPPVVRLGGSRYDARPYDGSRKSALAPTFLCSHLPVASGGGARHDLVGARRQARPRPPLRRLPQLLRRPVPDAAVLARRRGSRRDESRGLRWGAAEADGAHTAVRRRHEHRRMAPPGFLLRAARRRSTRGSPVVDGAHAAARPLPSAAGEREAAEVGGPRPRPCAELREGFGVRRVRKRSPLRRHAVRPRPALGPRVRDAGSVASVRRHPAGRRRRGTKGGRSVRRRLGGLPKRRLYQATCHLALPLRAPVLGPPALPRRRPRPVLSHGPLTHPERARDRRNRDCSPLRPTGHRALLLSAAAVPFDDRRQDPHALRAQRRQDGALS